MSVPSPITVLLVDDHSVVREGYRRLLERSSGITVVGEAANAADAYAEFQRVQPDVVLGMGGYVAFPGGMMASLLNRPLAVHEQNSVAGLTNRLDRKSTRLNSSH